MNTNFGFAREARFGVRRSATGRIRRGELDAAFRLLVRCYRRGFSLLDSAYLFQQLRSRIACLKWNEANLRADLF